MPPQLDEDGHETIEVTDARQGRPGKRILLILLVSAGAAAILLLLLLVFTGPRLAATTEGEAMEARIETPIEQPAAD